MIEVLFDNQNINSRFDIFLAERPVIPSAEMAYETITVPGRDGALTREIGYKTKPISLRFNYIHKENVKKTFRDITNWLTNKKTIRLTDDLIGYRVITQLNIKDATNDLKGYADFVINLETEPFWYENAGVETITSGTTTIANPSVIETGVVMTVYGTGTCRVRVNDNQMVFMDVQDFVIVDGLRGIAHKHDASQDNKMSGRYPVFLPGNNEIEVGGAITRVEIEKRWSWR
uniref:distal tail protein Dit n=1 Tax=Jeotgalibaca porci TaxID=1868793 RepID=UPI0035A0A7A2